MLTLSWTSSGGNGSVGSAYLSDIRSSKGAISDENWAGATPATGEPSPLDSGSYQQFTLGNLDTGTTYCGWDQGDRRFRQSVCPSANQYRDTGRADVG